MILVLVLYFGTSQCCRFSEISQVLRRRMQCPKSAPQYRQLGDTMSLSSTQCDRCQTAFALHLWYMREQLTHHTRSCSLI